jgi:hypothetical protein
MNSHKGLGSRGEEIDPTQLPDDLEEAAGGPRPAPAPGLPISEEEYNRLKEAAKHSPASSKKQRTKAPTKKKTKKSRTPHR